jgi:Zn-dependent membrane protease YugP
LCQERDFIDLEQVLLCDSNDMSVAHMIQNDEEEYMRRSVSAVELISHDSKFLIQKTDRSKIFRIGNTITALELPPKYSQGKVI